MQIFSSGLSYQSLNSELPSRKCSDKAPAKCKTSAYVLTEICLQWSTKRFLNSSIIFFFRPDSEMFELFSVLTKHLLLFTQSFHSSVSSKNALHLCTSSVKSWIQVQSSDPLSCPMLLLCLFAFTQFLLVLYTICQNNTTRQKFQLCPILFLHCEHNRFQKGQFSGLYFT